MAGIMAVAMVMMVVMVVPVERQCPLRARSEQRPVFRCRGHDFRRAMATDMPIQADHPIRSAHHHMQFMADHQDRGAGLCTQGGNAVVERRRSGLIQPGGGFIQNKELGPIQKRPGQQRALKLAAGEPRHLPIGQFPGPGLVKRVDDLGPAAAVRQIEEPGNRYRHRWLNKKPLRHIAKAQARPPFHPAPGRGDGTDKRPDQGGFTGSIRAHQGNDLARADGHRNPIQNAPAHQGHADFRCRHQWVRAVIRRGHGASGRHLGQSPSASITVVSITKPVSLAAPPRLPLPWLEWASAIASQARQIMKAGKCASPG